ncbi:MAG: hypothetical protein WC916_01805 [Candidatus Woesearchaeota archaeon]
MRRGQISGQIFLYIAAVIVIGIIILFGVRMFANVGKMNKEFVSMDFQNSMTGDIKSLIGAYGSTAIKTYTLPSDFTEICFVDTTTVKTSPSSIDNLGAYPVIKSSVESGAPDNIFLFGKKSFGSFTISNMQIAAFPGFYCVQPTGRTVEIEMQSLGNSIIIKTGPSKLYCKNAEEKKLCNGLDIAFGTGYKSQCITNYKYCSECSADDSC